MCNWVLMQTCIKNNRNLEEIITLTIQIRPAQKEDVPQLMNLMYQYIVDFYQCPRPSEEALQGLIVHLLENPWDGLQFVASNNDGVLVGFATCISLLIHSKSNVWRFCMTCLCAQIAEGRKSENNSFKRVSITFGKTTIPT